MWTLQSEIHREIWTGQSQTFTSRFVSTEKFFFKLGSLFLVYFQMTTTLASTNTNAMSARKFSPVVRRSLGTKRTNIRVWISSFFCFYLSLINAVHVGNFADTLTKPTFDCQALTKQKMVSRFAQIYKKCGWGIFSVLESWSWSQRKKTTRVIIKQSRMTIILIVK